MKQLIFHSKSTNQKTKIMNKLLLLIVVLFASFTIFTSCDKDLGDIGAITGKYKLSMNGKVVAEGSSEEVGKLLLTLTINDGEDFGIVIIGAPAGVGSEVNLDGSNSSITIVGKNILGDGSDELYVSSSGKLKRISSDKISFEGKCMDISGTEYDYSGYVESKIF